MYAEESGHAMGPWSVCRVASEGAGENAVECGAVLGVFFGRNFVLQAVFFEREELFLERVFNGSGCERDGCACERGKRAGGA